MSIEPLGSDQIRERVRVVLALTDQNVTELSVRMGHGGNYLTRFQDRKGFSTDKLQDLAQAVADQGWLVTDWHEIYSYLLGVRGFDVPPIRPKTPRGDDGVPGLHSATPGLTRGGLFSPDADSFDENVAA